MLFMSQAEVAKLMGVSRAAVNLWIKTGALKASPFPGKNVPRIAVSDFAAMTPDLTIEVVEAKLSELRRKKANA